MGPTSAGAATVLAFFRPTWPGPPRPDGMDSDAMVSGSPALCGRRSPPETALCGAAAYSTLFTNERRDVSCPACLAEIERLLAGSSRRGPVAPRASARVV